MTLPPEIELTIFTKSDGVLSKTITLDGSGALSVDASACAMSAGWACRHKLPAQSPFAALAELINALPSSAALATGAMLGSTDIAQVTTASKAGGNTIARTRANFGYRPGQPALLLLDFDRKGMPDAIRQRIDGNGGFVASLQLIWAGFVGAGMVWRPSTSTGLVRVVDGQEFPGSGGEHVYIGLQNGADAERFLRALHDAAWAAGYGWYMVGRAGQILERSIVDVAVWAPERLIFEGPPVLGPGLRQDAERRRAQYRDGTMIDSRKLVLSDAVNATATTRKREAEATIKPEAERVRRDYLNGEVRRLTSERGIPDAEARALVNHRLAGDLCGSDILEFDALGRVAVAEVLADPAKFDGATLADPLEGIEYGRGKAKLFVNPGTGRTAVHSFAHGDATYQLWHDARSAGAILDRAGSGAASALPDIIVRAKLTSGQEDELIVRASRLSDCGKRSIQKDVDARKRKVRQDERAHRLAEAGKPVITVAGGNLADVVTAADAALSAVAPPEVFQRAGRLVRVADMPEGTLHGCRYGARPMIQAMTDHDLRVRVAEVASWEKMANGEAVDINPPLEAVQSLAANAGHWTVPPLLAITDVPILRLDSGAIHTARGYDPVSNLFHSASAPGLDVPVAPTRDDALAAAATVLAPFAEFCFADPELGRAALLAYILTGAIRQLIDLAPGFLVSATTRGSGKGLLVQCVNLLLFGRQAMLVPPVTGGNRDEEMRKRITSILMHGAPSLQFDNWVDDIGGGPLDALLTAPEWSDRVLGANRMASLPARVLLAATGNNLAAYGDAARRWLRISLDPEMERPELRTFRIADLPGHIRANRARLLSAVFTILRGFIMAGRPGAARHVLGSFEEWSAGVPAAIRWLGMRDPLDTQIELVADDPATADLKALLAAWAVCWPGWVRVSEIIEACGSGASIGLDAAVTEARNVARERLLALSGGAVPNTRRIGKYLSQHHGRIVGGLALQKRENPRLKIAEWHVGPAAERPLPPPPVPMVPVPPPSVGACGVCGV